MTDLLVRLAPDGGEIDWVNGEPVMTDGIETAVILSLFGGNEQDSGSEADDSKQWWGNLGEQEPARRYRSETQALLLAIAATTANLRRVEEAAARDLAWLTDSIALSVDVSAGIPARNQIGLDIAVNVQGGGVVRISRVVNVSTVEP